MTKKTKELKDLLEKLIDSVAVHPYAWLDTMYNKILEKKPTEIIEFGTKTGLTTICMALALKEAGLANKAKITTYDSWGWAWRRLPGHNYTKEQAIKNIYDWSVSDMILVKKMNFWKWVKKPESFDLLYLDIDNDGEKIKKLYAAVKPQIRNGSIILFEGGSIDRDNIEWMKNRVSMTSIKDHVQYQIIDDRWPSLSMIDR